MKYFTQFITKKFTGITILSVFTGLCLNSSLLALPAVEQLIDGNIAISAEGNALQINQTTDKAIINWQNFNIATQESVHFQQPTNGIYLNKIYATKGMSQIA